MRRVALSLVLVAGLAMSAPALASGDAPAPAAPAAKPAKPAKLAKDDPNRIVCTREHVVGSNRPEKVCMTVAERERIKDLSSRALDESKRVGPQNAGGVQGE